MDPGYSGGSIGEYQFFDRETQSYDKSTCHTKRCAKMDCHEPHSHFKLIGVYKETDGLEDWAEQLFKHHGYCQWDEDTYSFMQNYRERWPTTCTQLYRSDSEGNTLYMGLKPLPEGNITIGVYYNDQCTQQSTLSWSDYIMLYYNYYYYGNSAAGAKVAATWESAIQTYNEGMDVYKICQPCRAYNLNKNGDGDSEGSHDRDEGRDLRLLGGDENDGEGEEEPWGYNCYDDAGYTNCNQVGLSSLFCIIR